MRIVVAGAGSVGRYLVERLVVEGHDIVLIDQNESLLEEVSSSLDISVICGSASSLDCLRTTDLKNADIFIAATSSDETNVISCLLADSMNQGMRKIARVRTLVTDESGLSPTIRSVFDHFINPDREAAAALLRLFAVPGASEVLEFVDGRVQVIGISILGDTALIGTKLRDLAAHPQSSSILIVAIIRSGTMIIPRGEDEIQLGDIVYVATEPDKSAAVFEILGRKRPPIRNVFIWGGTGVGQILARELSEWGVKVRLIESNAIVAATLANDLNDVLVLHGDATDQNLLRQEGIGEADIFIGATNDDENNILSGLLAKQMGAQSAAAVVLKNSYLQLLPTLGVDAVVNPRIQAASSILKFVRSGRISSIFSIRDDTAEILEIATDNRSKIINKTLRDLALPDGVIVAAVVHNGTLIIPKGDTVIADGDKVVLFVHRTAMRKVEKLLQVKFSFFH